MPADMMNFIDISNHQGRAGISLPSLLPNVDAVVVKATEGLNYVDPYCDGFVQTCIKKDVPFGFYHFARRNSAEKEADFFIRNCKGYFGKGIPILDWEDGQTVVWVNAFVRRVHSKTGIWPWIYANPWRFEQGKVVVDCMRWVASYPAVKHPTFAQARKWGAPEAPGLVGAWQFCSDGRVKGYDGNLDCNIFYGDRKAWDAYVGKRTDSGAHNGGGSGDSSGVVRSEEVLENDSYKVTIERKK